MAPIPVIQNKLINPLQHYLEDIDLRTDFIEITIDFKKLYDQNTSHFNELAEEMEIEWTQFLEENLKFSFSLLHLQPTDYHLFFEQEYHFNRYRLKTLRNSFYQNTPFFDLQKWRTYCRAKEKEAFKAGLVEEIWAPTMAGKLLGESDDPGYFGGTGSSGWKLQAIANFCLDIYMKEKSLKFIRLSFYDSFMSKGKIELIGNSLKLRKDQLSIQKMISRKVGYDLPKNEDEITEE